ncbi:hypothetical protein QMP26_41405 (plasmid) [Enterocloster clostridioformis]
MLKTISHGIFRKYKNSILCTFLFSIFMTIVGLILTLFSLSSLTDTGNVSIGEQRYTLIDNLLDSDSFSAFRHSDQSVNNLGEFYNGLIEMKEAKLLSLYTQAINIDDFKGGKQFYYNTEEFLDEFKDISPTIKALQINNIAYEYYGIKTKKGVSPNWPEISYDNDMFPVILGSNYEGIYNIGDIFDGSFLFKDIRFKVIGILENPTLIYYKTDPNFDLADYIIMPYPAKAWKVETNDFRFEGMLYFNMINSDVVTNSGAKTFLAEIRNVANTTGFIDFSIIGIDQLFIKNQDLLIKMEKYKLAIFGLLSVLFILVTAIIYKTVKLQYISLTIGDKPNCKQILWHYGKIYLLSFVISYSLQILCIPRIYRSALIINFVIFLFSYTLIAYKLMKFHEKGI